MEIRDIKTLTLTFEELEEGKFESVTDYARQLMKTNPELKDLPINVYRDGMLCVTANSVETASKIEPQHVGFRIHRPSKTRRPFK